MYRRSDDDRRWVGVGASDATDAAVAGAEATKTAIAGDDVRLLVVFASDDYDLRQLVNGIADVAPEVPLIGCSTAGEIRGNGAGDHSVVVTAFGGDFTVGTSVARGAAADLHHAGAVVAGAAGALGDEPHRILILLSDGLAGDQQEIVRGAYATLGAAVPLVGGCAGDGLRMRRTHQLYGREVLTDAVVGAAVGSEAPIAIGVRHGWRPVGARLLVTASRGNRVYRLNDGAALDEYLDHLDAPPEVRTDPEAFTRFAITHPLGLERRTGSEVRFIGGADFDERSLTCIAEVPQGELAWIMEGDEHSVLEATDAACADAREGLQGREPIGLVAFDCIARRGVLGDEGITTEVERIGAQFPTSPLAGFYTYGEFARTHGTRGFHNQTLVVLALA